MIVNNQNNSNINIPSSIRTYPECIIHHKRVTLLCFHQFCDSRLLCTNCLRTHDGTHNLNYHDIDEFLNLDPLEQIDKHIQDLELKEKARINKTNSLLCEIECLFYALQETFSKKVDELKEKIINKILLSQNEENLNSRLAEKIANSRSDIDRLLHKFKTDEVISGDELSMFVHKFTLFQKVMQNEAELLNPNNFIETIDNNKKQEIMKDFEFGIQKYIKLLEHEIHNIMTPNSRQIQPFIKPETIKIKTAFAHEQIGGCWIQGFSYLKVSGIDVGIVGDDKGSLKLWDLHKQILLYDYKEKKGSDKTKISSLIAYPSTAQIIAAYGNQIRVYDILPNFSLFLAHTFTHHKCDVYALEPIDHSSLILSGEWDNDSRKLYIWRVDSGQIKQEIKMKFGCYSIRQLRGTDLIAIGHWKGNITLYEMDSSQTLTESQFLIGHTDTVVDFVWHDHSRMLFSSSDDMTIRQWHLPRGTCVKVFDMKKEKAGNLLLQYENDLLMCTAYDGTIKIFKISTGQLIHEILVTQNFKPMLVSCAKRRELITRDKTYIKIWSYNTN